MSTAFEEILFVCEIEMDAIAVGDKYFGL